MPLPTNQELKNKQKAVESRMREIVNGGYALLRLLEEPQLDAIVLALGIGAVKLND